MANIYYWHDYPGNAYGECWIENPIGTLQTNVTGGTYYFTTTTLDMSSGTYHMYYLNTSWTWVDAATVVSLGNNVYKVTFSSFTCINYGFPSYGSLCMSNDGGGAAHATGSFWLQDTQPVITKPRRGIGTMLSR